MLDARHARTVFAAVTWLLASSATACEDAPHAFRHAEPGNFDYYVLVLAWSPTYCLKEGDKRGNPQCDSKQSRHFVLHGLWPQDANGWPEDCYQGERPWVPSQVIGEMRDIMPSKALVIHEYKAHGTCSGLAPGPYFDAARILYDGVTVPAPFDDPETQRFLSLETVERKFLAANPWLKPDMIAVTCRRGSLFDIRLCFDRDFRPQACGTNIGQRHPCSAAKIAVPVP
jgi:ribonuclease T2